MSTRFAALGSPYGQMLDDSLGQRTVRANMHPGYQSPDAIAPAGPVTPP